MRLRGNWWPRSRAVSALIVVAFFAGNAFAKTPVKAGEKLIHENLQHFLARFGTPAKLEEEPEAVPPEMVVQRFRKVGWDYVVYFHHDVARRVIVSKETGEKLSDEEIAELLLPNQYRTNSWSLSKDPNRRGWASSGGWGGFHAVVSDDGKALEFVTTVYRLIHEKREDFVTRFGNPVERVEKPRAALHGMDVQRFRKDGWEYVVYFEKDVARRVIVSKESGEQLSDAEIAEILLPNGYYSSWNLWTDPSRRAWRSGGFKAGVLYAVVSNDAKALEFVTTVYLDKLGQEVWLDSVDTADAPQLKDDSAPTLAE
jgi:hypothetical protein